MNSIKINNPIAKTHMDLQKNLATRSSNNALKRGYQVNPKDKGLLNELDYALKKLSNADNNKIA